jgi:serine/threonine-protein kinase
MADEPTMSPSQTQVEPGSRIASYEVVRLIGRGGMSEVYEAIQIGTGRRIALKLLGGRRAEDARYVERLQREGYALARIRHPNVVVVYDAGVSDGQAWIAMDLLEGQSMRDLLLERGRLPLPQALAYAGAIFDGLEAAHRLGIVHRDMKPENVFLTHDGGLKIVDFGNAKLLNSGLKSTDPHKVFGTAAYMSPEQLGFRRSVGPRSDLYAAGLMLYEMILGRHAFSEGPDAYDLPPSLELCRLQIEEEPAPLALVEPKIPSFVSDFVARLMAKDPERRPPSAFLAAREVRDMHDFILREAHSAGLAPAAVSLGSRRSPDGTPGSSPKTPSLPASLRPSTRDATQFEGHEPARRDAPSTGLAILVGAVLGAAIFGILFVSRGGTRNASASSGLPATNLESPARTAAGSESASKPRPSATPPPSAAARAIADAALASNEGPRPGEPQERAVVRPSPSPPEPIAPTPRTRPKAPKAASSGAEPERDPYAPVF